MAKVITDREEQALIKLLDELPKGHFKESTFSGIYSDEVDDYAKEYDYGSTYTIVYLMIEKGQLLFTTDEKRAKRAFARFPYTHIYGYRASRTSRNREYLDSLLKTYADYLETVNDKLAKNVLDFRTLGIDVSKKIIVENI